MRTAAAQINTERPDLEAMVLSANKHRGSVIQLYRRDGLRRLLLARLTVPDHMTGAVTASIGRDGYPDHIGLLRRACGVTDGDT